MNILQSKTTDLIKSFSREEMAEFRKFMNSPYFNESRKVSRLFEVIAPFYPEFESKRLNEKWIYKRVSPGMEFNRLTLKKMFTGLNQLLERFLAQKKFDSDGFMSEDMLFDQFISRSLHKYSVKCLDKCRDILAASQELDTPYFVRQIHHSNNEANQLIESLPHSNANAIGQITGKLSKKGYYAAALYLKEMVRCYDNLMTLDKNFDLNRERNFLTDLFELTDITSLFDLLKKNAYSKQESAMCDIYPAWHRAFSDTDDERNYYRYKESVFANRKYLSHGEMRFHLLRMMRYCLLKNAAATKPGRFDEELFDVYNIFIEEEYYKTPLAKHLSVEAFRPIVNLGLKLKKYDWTLKFINKYKSKLPPERRKNMFHYASALYFFHTGKYGESMQHSQKVEFDHFLFKLDLRDLMLMTLYELRAFENALSFIDSYKHFLKNDRTLADAEKKRHRNFINAVQKLVEFANCADDVIIMKIEDLMKLEHSNKEWLREKYADVTLQGNRAG